MPAIDCEDEIGNNTDAPHGATANLALAASIYSRPSVQVQCPLLWSSTGTMITAGPAWGPGGT